MWCKVTIFGGVVACVRQLFCYNNGSCIHHLDRDDHRTASERLMYIRKRVVDNDRHNVNVLFENRRRVHLKRRPSRQKPAR